MVGERRCYGFNIYEPLSTNQTPEAAPHCASLLYSCYLLYVLFNQAGFQNETMRPQEKLIFFAMQ